MKVKIIAMLPFVILCCFVFYCWYELISKGYIPTTKHIIALILTLANVGAYFWNYKKAVIMTGIFLFMATFTLVAINVELVENSFFFKVGSMKIAFPSVNFLSFYLLLFYCLVNYKSLGSFLTNLLKFFNH